MNFLSRQIGSLTLVCVVGTAQVVFPGPELLGRPTDHSVTINVVASAAIEAYFEYGATSGGPYTFYPNSGAANPFSTAANVPLVAVLNGLSANTRYFYRMVYRQSGTTAWSTRPEHSFQTQRPPGGTFSFTITSDSHLNINPFGNTTLLQQTLQNVSNQSPDFHLDLGDTFAMDSVTAQAQADSSYLNLRPYFGLISHSVPVFLALGNHEQNEGWHLKDTGNIATSPPVMSANARNRYYLNPSPLQDPFYSGNTDNTTAAINGDHSIGDYYAWQWGDALFLVVDPYWYSTTKPFLGNTGGGEPAVGSGNRWDWTLGIGQYLWLKQTLENTDAKYKFLFAHQLPGGTSDYGRGGANAAPYVEMGGNNTDGTSYAFNSRRSGWPLPVHQLLVSNHVTAFFHGHDHEFAYEKRDGVVYQAVPMAADTSYGLGFQEYHETDPYAIRVLPNTGHLRVTISPAQATVDYVRAFLSGGGTNGQVAYSYTMAAYGSGHCGVAAPSIASVTSLTDFGGFASFASGSWLEIKGANLSPNTRTWTSGDFAGSSAPTSLDGIFVSINNKPAFVYYISPNQINVQAPADPTIGPVSIGVTNCAGTSAAVTMQKAILSPGMLAPAAFKIGGNQFMTALFSGEATYVGAPNLIPGASFRPAKPGDAITAYGIGFGDVTPSIAPGTIATGLNSLGGLSISFGGAPATITYAGLAPGTIGLFQFDFKVPNVPDGDYQVKMQIGSIAVQQALLLTVKNQ